MTILSRFSRSLPVLKACGLFYVVAVSAIAQTSGSRPLVESLSVHSPELLAWRTAEVSTVAPDSNAHSIHSYFNTNPESPDGQFVVYFHSTARTGESGALHLLNRKDGSVRVLKTGITAEDAHRVACQQWAAGGRFVAYHDFRDGRWLVAAIDIENGTERILAADRQIGFGAVASPWVPIYGWHWKQGPHRDLELANVLTGEIRKALTIDAAIAAYGADIRRAVGEGDVSVFFPVMSPDSSRVFFKIARGSGGDDFRSKGASAREGKVVFNFTTGKFVQFYKYWGHPVWMPDSPGILENNNRIYFPDTGKSRPVAPDTPDAHPSPAPDGRLFATDALIARREGGRPDEWAIMVASIESSEYIAVHRFIHKDGARSWRGSHPHPVFSADGRRIYFNVSNGDFTRLHVAENKKQTAALVH